MKTNYFCTHSGKEIYIDRFSADMVSLDDIAHHLASPCNQRYGGAQDYDKKYSVAQHSILMAEWCLKMYRDTELAKLALLHDASEAYLGDINSILKQLLPDYLALEAKVQHVILEKYTCATYKLSGYDIVDTLDKVILVNEVKALFPTHIQKKYINERDTGIKGLHVNPYRCPEDVKREFLEWCERLEIRDE